VTRACRTSVSSVRQPRSGWQSPARKTSFSD